MKKIALYLGLIALAAPSLLVVPAQAQATRTWISGVGDDVNPCSRTAPCKTFPGAISKTAPGGEIDTLDPGGFGAVTVVKAITLAQEGSGEAGILVAGTNGITVNCTDEPTNHCTSGAVIVRGLNIDGGPTNSNSLAGIKFFAGKTLIVQNCIIKNFTGGSPNGFGIDFAPNSAAELDVSDSVIATNGQAGGGATVGGGIFIEPVAGGSAKATINNVEFLNNTNGIIVDNTLGAALSTVNLTNSVINGSGTNGVSVKANVGGTKGSNLFMDHDVVSNSGTDGVVVHGGKTQIFLANTVVTGNAVGIFPNGGGVLFSFANNNIFGNTTDNANLATPATPN